MKKESQENAAKRINFCADIYDAGALFTKSRIKKEIPDEYKSLHEQGYIHIHDLEGYGQVYNCSMPNFKDNIIKNIKKSNYSSSIMIQCFSILKNIITEIGNSQTGGIGVQDIDTLISSIYNFYNIRFTKGNRILTKDCLSELIYWINTTRTRYCREPYYITLNLGMDISKWGRFICESILDIINLNPTDFVRPNVVFKVKKGVNFEEDSVNYDMFLKAIKCSAKRMIPTFLLMDSEPNKKFKKEELGIMGCRTRVVANCNGNVGTMGRGNVANISINLPRIALESLDYNEFKEKLIRMMDIVHDILLDRVRKMEECNEEYLKYIITNNIWIGVNSVNDMIKQGTLSIGFIGLSETVEILTKEKIYESEYARKTGYEIISEMRQYVDKLLIKEKLNYSLLASPGEMISGRFCEIDREKFHHSVHSKGYYTNSFHIDVDSRISIFKKIDLEAPFHLLCNGGCITYIEFAESPLYNELALYDAISYSIKRGISYLAFNYPMDICNLCSETGTFDNCPKCKSKDIKRIRRVSGYLEDINYFSKGKKAEVKKRKPNG